MLFSRDWLAEYVDLGGVDDAELAERLTAAGLAVEGTEERGDDLLLDVDVTTNRPDAMCHLGLARELATILGRELRLPAAAPAEGDEAVEAAARVTIDDATGCPRYAARVVRGVRVGPSPEWLRRRLESIGLRPINNVVDVTNFVLWETGQPLHGFDLSKLAGDPLPEIRVRRAHPGEELVTLDGERRELSPEMLVIADAEDAVALAGVMGGLASEVTGATADVLIESAHFDRKAVRLTASVLGMHTDASHRFERGSDPGACLWAASRAAALIAEVAGGTVLAGGLDARGAESASWPPRGRLDLARLDGFAGVEVAASDVERWLGGLGFALEREEAEDDGGKPVWRLTVPSWRYFDFEPQRPDGGGVWEADLFEEVLRLHGLDGVPAALPAIAGSDGPRTPVQRRRDRIRDHLAACGYAEAINYAFGSSEADAAHPALPTVLGEEAPPLALVNPLSDRYRVMRRSLLPNLLASAEFNLRRGAESVRLFEIGHVFFDRAGRPGPEGLPVLEVETLGAVCGGHFGTPWDRRRELDLFDLKGVLESLAEALGTPLVARPATLPGLIEGTSASLHLAAGDGPAIGCVGRLEAPGLGDFALYAAEVATAGLGSGDARGGELEVELPSRHPTVEADLTLTHSESVPFAELAAAVEETRPPELLRFGLVVRYRGEGVPEGAVNTTLGFVYGSAERSLTQEEVNERQQAVTDLLARRFAWQETR